MSTHLAERMRNGLPLRGGIVSTGMAPAVVVRSASGEKDQSRGQAEHFICQVWHANLAYTPNRIASGSDCASINALH
jgi:hypothetical protein